MLHQHFQVWDDEKYNNLATFIHNNWKQAIQIITDEGRALSETLKRWDLTEADLERWAEEERTYFENVGEEPQYDVLRVTYVQLLQDLARAQ
jgi:hypothetical protein